MLSFEKVNEVLKTLPIGYYLGRKITCTLHDNNESYHDPFNDEIRIGFKLLPCTNVDTELSDEEIEKDIRCMLYHEISHALITPRIFSNYDIYWIKNYYRTTYGNNPFVDSLMMDKMHSILNVFEDQRIETVLGTYFLNVNFPEYVKKVNHYDGYAKPTSTWDAYYQIVRYNEGPKEFVDKVYSLIKNYAGLGKYEDYTAYKYFIDVLNLYVCIKDYYKFEEKEDSIPEGAAAPTKLKITVGGDSDSSKDSDKSEKLDLSKVESVEVEFNGEPSKKDKKEDKESEPIMTPDELENLLNEIKDFMVSIKPSTIRNIFNSEYRNPQLDNKITNIILNAKRKKGLTASSHQTHFGKLNPKYIGKKLIEDYRWCDKSLSGEKNSSTKLQLNLFVDISGSFRGSEAKLNQLLFSLNELQKKNKDFVCRLVTMGDKNLLRNSVQAITCDEGNYLKNEIIDIYKKCQNSANTNYNVVVFDGDAQSFDCYNRETVKRMKIEHERAWSAWNHPNCVIISDPSNQSKFDKWSPSAKRIYTYNYTAEFESNIIKALEMLFK